MSKKRIFAVAFLSLAMFGVMTMTGCGGSGQEEAAPKIKTTIDPKNWARVEDYRVYEDAESTEPEETAPVEIVPSPTDPVIEETEPVVEETKPAAAAVYYNVAKDVSRPLVTVDLSKLTIGEDSFDMMFDTVSDLEALGFVKGDVEKNSGVNSQYFFDGYKYTKDNYIVYVDADEDGIVRAIKLTQPGVDIVDGKIAIDMALSNFYDEVEAILAEGENVARMTPASGVKSYTQLSSVGYRVIFTCTTDGIQEIAIFADEYVSTWGPISNEQ